MIALVLAAALTIIDGDTFRMPSGEVIRLKDVDAPELCKAACDAELDLAVAARKRLRVLLGREPLDIERRGKDRNGRTLAFVRAGGVDVGARLVAEGLAVVYEGRRHRWCPR